MKVYPPMVHFLLFLLLLVVVACRGGEEQPAGKNTATTEYQAAIRRLQNPGQVAALGKVAPEEEILELAFETSGRIQQLYIKEGQPAGSGALLIALDAALENNQLKALDVQLERNRLEKEDARAQVQYYEDVLEQQRQTYQRLKRSVDAQALPASELDQVELDIRNSRNQIDNATRLLQRLDIQSRELRVQQEEIQLRRQQKVLKAPGQGTILRWDVREGATVNAYEVVGEFAPGGALIVEAEVDEYFATIIREGQPAVIRREGYTDTLARGRVIYTADNLSDKSILSEDNSQFEDLQVRPIRILVDDGSELLLGMKVEALIQTAEK